MSQESAITLACRRPLELYAYNAQGMLAREAVYADTALTSQSVYAYDNRGNRITKTDTAGESRLVTGYTYDANNRLTKRSVGEYNTRVDTIYTYDANGNLYTTFGRSYTMDPYHRNSLLASVTSDSMGITQYTFNTVNQLVGVQKDGLTATYSYLPDGMRNEKTVNGVTTGHLWDGTNMVAETSGDAVVYKYVRGAGLLYTENATDEKTWYVKDAHGDTVQLTDGNGNIVWNYAYDAFGNQKETVNSGTEPYNPFRYTGEYFDAETGFIYLRARYMDPQTGRFISEDPVGDGVNWYVYAAGNPVAFYDPNGLAVTAWDKEHCTDTEIAELQHITNMWNAANQSGNIQQMEYAHYRAEQIRNQYRTNGEHGFDDGNTGSNGEKYSQNYWVGNTQLTAAPQSPITHIKSFSQNIVGLEMSQTNTLTESKRVENMCFIARIEAGTTTESVIYKIGNTSGIISGYGNWDLNNKSGASLNIGMVGNISNSNFKLNLGSDNVQYSVTTHIQENDHSVYMYINLSQGELGIGNSTSHTENMNTVTAYTNYGINLPLLVVCAVGCAVAVEAIGGFSLALALA